MIKILTVALNIFIIFRVYYIKFEFENFTFFDYFVIILILSFFIFQTKIKDYFEGKK